MAMIAMMSFAFHNIFDCEKKLIKNANGTRVQENWFFPFEKKEEV